jgi:hypothetical protein
MTAVGLCLVRRVVGWNAGYLSRIGEDGLSRGVTRPRYDRPGECGVLQWSTALHKFANTEKGIGGSERRDPLAPLAGRGPG